jgi:hypothetical protein
MRLHHILKPVILCLSGSYYSSADTASAVSLLIRTHSRANRLFLRLKTADWVQFRGNPVEGVAIAVPPTFRSCSKPVIREGEGGVERNSM